jgi:arylsulfatase A-like enzyme
MLNYYDVHHPYEFGCGSHFSSKNNPARALNLYISNEEGRIEGANVSAAMAVYDDLISCVDYEIGRLVAEVKRKETQRETLIIITADHGESFGDNGFFIHGRSLHKHLLHVPLILWYPGHIPAQIRISEAVTTTSLASTVWDLIGEGKDSFPGRSIANFWNSTPSDQPKSFLLAELAEERWPGRSKYPVDFGGMKSLITLRWHYIVHQALGESLFDLQEDPKEEMDVSKRPGLKPILDEFRRRLGNEMRGSIPY